MDRTEQFQREEEAALGSLFKLYGRQGAQAHLLRRGRGLVISLDRDANTGTGLPSLVVKVLPIDADHRHTLARIHWLQFLRQNGLLVPDIVLSQNGIGVESVDWVDVPRTVYAYRRLPGGDTARVDWSQPGRMRQLGRVMGKMHALAQTYNPPLSVPPAPHWDKADWLAEPKRVLHRSQHVVVDVIRHLHDELQTWSTAADYGLIHDDLHLGNLFADGDSLGVLDFDLTHISWYAADIASAVLFRVWIGPERERMLREAGVFLRELAAGYSEVRALPVGWREMLPALLRLRELSLFQSYYRHSDAQREPEALFIHLYNRIVHERPFWEGDWDVLWGPLDS